MRHSRTRRAMLRITSLLALSLALGALLSVVMAWCFAIWETPGALTSHQFLLGATSDGRGFQVDRSRGVGVVAAEIRAGVVSPEMQESIQFGFPLTPPPDWSRFDWSPPTSPELVVGIIRVEDLLPHWSATHHAVRAGGLVPPEVATLRVRPLFVSITENTFVLSYQLRERGVGWPRVCLRSLTDSAGRTHHALTLPTWLSAILPNVISDSLPTQPVWRGLLGNTLIYATPFLAIFLLLTPVQRSWRRRRGRCPGCNYDLQQGFDAGCPECGWGRGAIGDD